MTEQTPTNSDRTFEETLRAQLALAPGLGDVHATVNAGVVTLSGNVREEMDIKRAVLITKAVEGLSEVRQEMKVIGASQVEQDGRIDPVEGISSSPATKEAAAEFSPVDEGLNPPLRQIKKTCPLLSGRVWRSSTARGKRSAGKRRARV